MLWTRYRLQTKKTIPMPTLKTIYDSYPQPKCKYYTFTKRLRSNHTEIDAIKSERQGNTTTIKHLYESYPQPKCSYNRFWVRIKKWLEPDEAIIQRNKYHPRMTRAKKIALLEKQISDLTEKRTKYNQGTKMHSNIQEKKNKLVRSLSVYKSR